MIHSLGLIVLSACAAPSLDSYRSGTSGERIRFNENDSQLLVDGSVADEAASGTFTFDDLCALLERRNPELRAAASAVHAAEGRMRQSGLYPNPTAEAEVEDYDVGETGMEGAETTLRLTQPIFWGEKRRATIAAERAEVFVRRLERDRLALELLGALRGVYDDLLYFRRALALNDELTSFSRQSLEIARTRFALRASPESDVSRAEVETFDLSLERRDLVRERARAMARLTALLGGAGIRTEQIEGVYEPTIDRLSTDTLRSWLLEEHPAVRVVRVETEAAEARLAKERSERLPDLSVTVGYGRSRAASNNVAEAAIGIELPIFDRNQGAISAAKAEIEEAIHREAALENRLLAELGEALADWNAARERKAIHTRQVLPSALRAFEQVREGYRAGKLGFLELIDAQRTLTAARLQQLQLIREIRRAEARLFGLAGPAFTPLETKSSLQTSKGETR
jgi:cobalt-zinc-cadmium efflux system outer membrane protein